MGLIEALLEHVSIKNLFIALVGTGAFMMTINRITEHRRIKKLGNYGPSLPSRYPFGEPSSITSFTYKNYERNHERESTANVSK